MKRQLYFLVLVLLLAGNKMYSQAAANVFIENLGTPNPMVINGNTMYIGIYYLDKVVKVNIDDPSAAPIDVVTGVNRPYGLALKDNILYVSEFGAGRLSKVDLTAANPTPQVILGGISSPLGLEFVGNELYMALEGDNKIAKIDVSQANPQLIDVIPAKSPFEIEIINNVIYFTERFEGKLSKFDMTTSIGPTTIAQGLSYPSGLAFHGKDLFICEAGASKVSKINVTQSNPVVSTGLVSTGFDYPSGLAVKDNMIYVTDFFAGSVLKADLAALSVSDHKSREHTTLIYPNPAKETLKVMNAPSQDYKIYGMVGNLVLSGKLERDSIDVSKLIKGAYIIQIGDVIKKFIKD
ncbi:T9SS type A sorting domain-containing protein [Chryseobacterium sp. OSA05B]|uniref:T9SS type A sorting domain-containing protein n=1 Tax=Chryseobacterium sp. OSA05B TaxID=2862650 RepID=UPI001CBF3F52|nr:T9SS type A sorting domain-containing protein [Chryseobacterium sp. OSA05B]